MDTAVVEQRYRTVPAVEQGEPRNQVAARFGVSGQTLHTWITRYRADGVTSLVGGHPGQCRRAPVRVPDRHRALVRPGPRQPHGSEGRPLPCRPRRDETSCEHGTGHACRERHATAGPRVGRPLCVDCYDHPHQAVGNLQSTSWRRRMMIAATATCGSSSGCRVPSSGCPTRRWPSSRLAATNRPPARPADLVGCAPGRTRTCDLEIRRLLLYPAELRGPAAPDLVRCGSHRSEGGKRSQLRLRRHEPPDPARAQGVAPSDRLKHTPNGPRLRR